MVGDGQRGAAVRGGKEANERLVRPRRGRIGGTK